MNERSDIGGDGGLAGAPDVIAAVHRTRPRVLVLDERPGESTANHMVSWLATEGYDSERARSAADAVDRWRKGGVDLILLDARPGLSDFGVCVAVRGAAARTPIVVLTAKGKADERARSFELGGDDCLSEPFHPHELLRSLRALLRSQSWRGPGAVSGPVGFGPCEVDFGTSECVERSGARSKLTPREAGILRALMEEPGRPVRREALVRQVWPSGEPAPTARTVDNFVLRLRKRFERDPRRPEFILTVFGVGYRFVP